MLKDLMRNKTTGFGELLSVEEFRDVVGQEHSVQQIDEQLNLEPTIVTEEEISEYIVENPKEVVVEFPIISDVKLEEKLPFFRAICYKLGGI